LVSANGPSVVETLPFRTRTVVADCVGSKMTSFPCSRSEGVRNRQPRVARVQPAHNPPPGQGRHRLPFISAPAAGPISPRAYKGFTITPRTFQVRGSGRWTIDILIGRRGSLRAFSQPDTLTTESAAIEECWMLARRIIDQSTPHCSVYDLTGV